MTQCIILAPGDVFRVTEAPAVPQQLWLDNIYLRVARNAAAASQDALPNMLDISGPAAEVWVTSATFQSDNSAARGLAPSPMPMPRCSWRVRSCMHAGASAGCAAACMAGMRGAPGVERRCAPALGFERLPAQCGAAA
jgi:hypothetical protein